MKKRLSFFVGAVLALALPALAAEPSTAASLRGACDELLRNSIVVGQNRGWPTNVEPPDKRGGRRFDFSPDVTPASGLILVRASKVFNEPKYLAAAEGVARSLAAAQSQAGYVPAAVTMFPAGPRSDVRSTTVLPPSSTAAALAFWLTLADADAPSADRWRACARNATNWLIQQQLGGGGFVAPTTNAAISAHPVRRIDLTRTDYRNIVAALQLAARMQISRPAANAAEKAVNRLLTLRLMFQAGAPATAPAKDDDDDARNLKAALCLWTDAYDADGSPADGQTKMHTLASSQALQILLIEASTADKFRWPNDLQLTLDAFDRLATDGHWRWQYPALPTTQPTSDANVTVFGPLAATTQPAPFDLPPILAAGKTLKDQTSETKSSTPVEKQGIDDVLAGLICGLNESPAAPANTALGKLWNDLHP